MHCVMTVMLTISRHIGKRKLTTGISTVLSKNPCVFLWSMFIISKRIGSVFLKEGAMYNPAIADMISMAGRVQRDTMGAQVITKTLDFMNSAGSLGYGASVGISNNVDYNFQTSVLNAAYSGKGTFVDVLS
jgi:hypothetical protein